MLQLEHTYHLFTLLLIPIFVALFLFYQYWQKQAIKKIGDVQLIKRLIPAYSNVRKTLKFSLLMLVIVFLSIAYANPQIGTKKEKIQQKSIDVFIALDVSNSMLARDISPNRLERTKRFCNKLLKEFRTDRVGIILFAGDAYVQMPLTTDYATAQAMIKSAQPNMVSTQGTAIGSAINLAEESFDKDNKQHKVLLLISDGENHDDNAINIAETAGENGLLIFTVGIGSKKSSPILITEFGQTSYKKNAAGEVIYTRLEEAMLKEIAEAARGTYFKLKSDDKILSALNNNIQKIEKREIEQRAFKEFETYFQWFVLLAIIFLAIELLISNRLS